MKPRTAALAAAAGLAAALGGIAAWYLGPVPLETILEQQTVADRPNVGGPFTLVSQNGETVTEKTFRGEFLLVFFGYTFCPDVCPTTLAKVSQSLDLLGNDAERVRPLFITVDPARDTVAQMADYVGHFHPRILGLTGTPQQIAAVAMAYRAYYAKAPGETGDDNYLMDHSALLYLMAPDGAYLTAFSPETPPNELAEAIRGYLHATS